jgi:peptidyl-prolyl cis-trans isomerase D
MALKELRAAGKGWIAGMFMIILVTSVGAWGISDMFVNFGGRGVARVGGDWIGTNSFQERLRFAADRVGRDLGKPLTAEQAQKMGLPARVLEQMIDERAVDVVGQRLGLGVHDDTLKRVIRSTSAFQGGNGQFDPQLYKNLLAQNRLTPARYEADLRADITRSQLQSAVAQGSFMPRGLLETLIAFRGEMREVSYVLLEPGLVGNIPAPDKATLQGLINAEKDTYSTPELRSFVALLIRPEDLTAQARSQIADSEVAEQYKFHEAEYKIPEQRTVRIIAFPSEAVARQAMASLESHAKSFEEVGRTHGFKVDALAFKAQARKDVADPEVATAVFAATGPGFIGPVNGTLAWAIAELKEITPERVRALDEVKDEIRESLAKARAEDLVYETVSKFEDARAGGSTFEEIAATLKVPLVKYDEVDAQGRGRTGKTVASGHEAEDLLTAAFQAEVGVESDPAARTEGGQFVIRLDTVAPPALKPFEEIETAARAAYESTQRAARLKAKADELVTAHAKDGLGAIAAELGVPAATLPAPLRRADESEVLSPKLVEDLFRARPQTLILGDSAQAGKFVIATVFRIDRPSPTDLAQGVQAVGQQVDRTIAQDVAQTYVNAARAHLGVKVNQRMLDQATSAARL